MTKQPSIGIVGAGMAGLSAALALARIGVRSTLFERAPTFEEVGAGLQISPNASRVLIALGLGDRLTAASVRPTGIGLRRGDNGRPLAHIPLGPTAESRWGAPYLVVHRADLQEMLVDAVRGRAEITLEQAEAVTDVTGGEPYEIVADGTRHGPFDAVIGADGLWSTVRGITLGTEPPRYSGKVAWRTTVPPAALPAGLDPLETGTWLGTDAHLVHYPVRGGSETNIVAVTTDRWREPGFSAPGDPQELLRRFAGWDQRALDLLRSAPGWTKWALADRDPVRRWGKGAITLTGDAAHPMLPFLAQGASMAIEDAWVLAACFQQSPDTPAAAFRRYEAARAERVARAQRTARRNGEIFHMGAIMSRARDAALKVLPKEQLLSQWDWLYGWRAPGL
ncbi:FAD-dependent monooxygenase [Lutibaculum baratangense]|uniref:Salicylate hydroxylase n=1 Tax=Lutibaculum baratangense AMV1 TaxID=631454 RepID=V4RG74_9HYPH|nr:FAD-dependent monooxygenase [Lutibaculum baratangense]ESR25146.1 Salicylate hydroxylase [Lutibaculum baratangense AMV1]